MVEDAADDERIEAKELERFDRQLRYFSDIGSASTPTPSECQERLREAKIAVLGVGGLGGWSALALACTGVGEMWLIDGDRVEVSNLNRQILYSEADIGELKVECAASRLRAFNSGMKITTEARRLESESDIAEFIAGSDIVIDAADWPAHDIERWCNSACFEAGIPYITMSHFPPIARVGPALRSRQDRLLTSARRSATGATTRCSTSRSSSGGRNRARRRRWGRPAG